MTVWQSPGEFMCPKRTMLSVGNFDGVHRGHTRLIQDVVQRAAHAGLCSCIVTFDPHTRTALNPAAPQPVLSTFEEKTVLLERLGVQHVVRVAFTAELRELSAAQFVDQLLRKRLNAAGWVMGEGHTFGAERLGTGPALHELLSRNDIRGLLLSLLTETGDVVSSTGIRAAIAAGDMARAVTMLGHPYLVKVRRVSGLGLGTELGYPTLNFQRPHPDKVLPPAGVYAAQLQTGCGLLAGALYFGTCSTLAPREVHFEMHLLGSVPDDIEQADTAGLWIHRFVRADRRFDSREALLEQISKDVTTIEHFFREGDTVCL